VTSFHLFLCRRTAHNPVDSFLLDETDRRGIIVWSEARFLRMWSNYIQVWHRFIGGVVAMGRNSYFLAHSSSCSSVISPPPPPPP
jgi:hypothetical protein